MANYRSVVIIFLLVLICACTSKDTIPKASGLPGDLYLLMDAEQYHSPLGELMDSIFKQPMPGLPREEPIFNMAWIDPLKLNTIIKQRRNLIIAFSLDCHSQGSNILKNFFTPESLHKIENDSAGFYFISKDVFSKGQEVLYLFAKTQKQLMEKVRKYCRQLVKFMDDSESERIAADIFVNTPLKGLPNELAQKYGCAMKLPFGYQLVQMEKDFFWARQINTKDDRDIFFSRKKYLSQEQFSKDSLIAFRNAICQKYLFEDPDRPETYLLTETEVEKKPVTTRPVDFNGQFAVEMRGLWRSNLLTMGGPFVGYALVDEKTGYFYYVEAFLYGPGKKQRELMRELEVILHSFEFPKAASLKPKK